MISPPTDWTPIILLPNLGLEITFEAEGIALVPSSDQRVQAFAMGCPKLAELLNRFHTPFGKKVQPSVLIVDSAVMSVPVTLDAVTDFRNIAAISVILYERSLSACWPGTARVKWAESFDFYPWMIGKDGHTFVGNSPALFGVHDVDAFDGQTFPALESLEIDASRVDSSLFGKLTQEWVKRYIDQKVEWRSTALFRSLSTALHGSRLPSSTAPTIYDAGRLVPLWISALEILVHQGEGHHAGYKQVFDLLESIVWRKPELSKKNYTVRKEQRTLISNVCNALYACRDDFLHGNPVSSMSLKFGDTKMWLSDIAASVYRMALTAFIPITVPTVANVFAENGAQSQSADDNALRMKIIGYQSTYEQALLLLI